MSLLKEIQESAIDASIPVTTLLRKCKVLAKRLGNEDFSLWVDKELNGYHEDDTLPEYRVFPVHSKGHFVGPLQSQLTNADIPLSCIPEEHRDYVSYHRMTQPISTYALLFENDSDKSGSLRGQWPADLVALVGQKIYQRMTCLSAWQVIPIGKIAAMIDSIRNRVLSFVLDIEAEDPLAGEDKSGKRTITPEKVKQVFNIHIAGNVGNVAAGSSQVSQSVSIEVVENNLETLLVYLRANLVPEDDLSELQDSIEADRKNTNQKEIGPKVTAWMAKMMKKAAKGTWNVGTAVAASVLTKAINGYLGIE